MRNLSILELWKS